MRHFVLRFILISIALAVFYPLRTTAQEFDDSLSLNLADTIYMDFSDSSFNNYEVGPLRIKNFTPFFNLHVDSTLEYRFEINKDPDNYYWYLKNPPVGLRINKDNGLLHFTPTKAYFLSGRLKYDKPYKVELGVQNLNDAGDKLDTTFTIVFFNTEIIPSKLKPSVAKELFVQEGDTVRFQVQCETGSFPIEGISYITNFPVRSSTPIARCGDSFTWVAPYDFIKEGDKVKSKRLIVTFVAVDQFFNRDTSVITINVNDAINYPVQLEEYKEIVKQIEVYIEQLKGTFMVLDQNVKNTRKTRTAFDLTSATTSLGGTVFSSLPGDGSKTAGKIMPSVGVALVPVKEAASPNKPYEQNSASLVRSDIQRLQYLLVNSALVGERDDAIVNKTNKMKDDLKQIQLQLIDVPIVNAGTNKTEIDRYFDSPKVKRKYRFKKEK